MTETLRWTSATACLMMALAGVPAASTAQPAPEAAFEYLSVTDGLSNPAISTLLEGRSGFLWAGTQKGLNRYDGYQFIPFPGQSFDHLPQNPLENAYITSLYQDEAGILWVGTFTDGLFTANPATGEVTSVNHWAPSGAPLTSNQIFAIAQTGDGMLGLATANGFMLVQPGTQRIILVPAGSSHPQPNTASTILQDRDGTILVGTDAGLYSLSMPDTVLHAISLADGPIASLLSGGIRASAIDHQGTLWLGTSNQGLYSIDTSRTVVRHHPIPSSTSPILALHEDREGALWVGTRTAGLVRLDRSRTTITQYQNDPENPASLSRNNVWALLEDRSGTLWVGAANGINKLRTRKTFTPHRTPMETRTPAVEIRSVFQDSRGDLWIGTEGFGLYHLPASGTPPRQYLQTSDPSSGPLNNSVFSFAEDDEGRIWMATFGGGISRLNPATGVFTHLRERAPGPMALSSDFITHLIIDQNNTLWAGSLAGLNRYPLTSAVVTHYHHDAQVLSSVGHDLVWTALETRSGDLWFGTMGGGLNRYNPETDAFVRYQHNPADSSSISSNMISSLFEDRDGVLWVGTQNGGLNAYHPETERFKRFTTQEGLPFDHISGIVDDDEGRLWIATANGLSQYDPATRTFLNYDERDGLPSNIFHMKAVASGVEGWRFFGTHRGLVAFQPASLERNSLPPPVVITEIQLFNEPALLDSAYHAVRSLEFPHNENYLGFTFAALDFTDPGSNRYAYQLEGIDDDWIHVGDRRFASYPNLQPGSYTFRVKGTNNDGVWNEAGAEVNLTIRPPFWATWWFRTSAVTLLLLLVLAGYRYRVGQLLERERMRMRIANDLHDDIGSKLSSIALMSDMIGKRSEPDTIAERYTQRISDNSRRMAEDLREIVWMVKPDYDKLENLFGKMENVASTLLQGTSFSFSAPQGSLSDMMSMDKRRHFFLMYKEMLNNIHKHANASRVDIAITLERRRLKLRVEDDGKGFDPSIQQMGNGMNSLRERAREIDGVLTIDSSIGAGTTLCLTLKL